MAACNRLGDERGIPCRRPRSLVLPSKRSGKYKPAVALSRAAGGGWLVRVQACWGGVTAHQVDADDDQDTAIMLRFFGVCLFSFQHGAYMRRRFRRAFLNYGLYMPSTWSSWIAYHE